MVYLRGEGRNRAPLVADDIDIMVDFTGDSSGLCHYWNTRFPLGLLAILLAISDHSLPFKRANIGGKITQAPSTAIGAMQ